MKPKPTKGEVAALVLLMAVLVIAFSGLMCGCNNPLKDDGAKVELTRWQSFGNSGARGYVKNNGNKVARDCRVKTKGSHGGGYMTSSTSPADILPGQTASFRGAASGPGGAIAKPEIIWIHWD